MDQCTENYECLVIHNNAKSNKLTDQVFWYKADPHDEVKLGSPEYWRFADESTNDKNNNNYSDDDYNKSKYVINKTY